jgi:hypothetical protein
VRRVWFAIAVTGALLAGGVRAAAVRQDVPPAPKPESEAPKPKPETPPPAPKPVADEPKSKDSADPAKPTPAANGTKPAANATQPATNATPPGASATQTGASATQTGASAVQPAANAIKPAAEAPKPLGDPVARADGTPPLDQARTGGESATLPASNQARAPVPTDPGVQAPKVEVRLDATRPIDASGFAVLVERLALEFPDLLRVQSLGKTRNGRDLSLLTASDTRYGDPAHKPALCVVCELPGASPPERARVGSGEAATAAASDARSSAVAGPEAALFLVARLLSDSQTRPELRALLQESTLYVLPAIDPEHVLLPLPGAGDAPRECRIDRNFPVGWQPWGDAPGSQGPYPLSEPESQSLAQFLAQRTNISAVLVLTRNALEAAAPRNTSEASRADRADRDARDGRADREGRGDREGRDERACERVCAMIARAETASSATSPASGAPATVLHPPADIARHGGDLTTFCEDFAGLSVFSTSPWGGTMLDTPFGSAPAGFEGLTRLVERTLSALPRLATDAPKVERLRNNLWMIDLGVHNRGLLATMCSRLRARGAGPSVSLRTSGAKLSAVGLKRAGESTYEPLRSQDGSAQIGHLEGEEGFDLRLLVEAPENTALELAIESPRAGQKLVKVQLQ